MDKIVLLLYHIINFDSTGIAGKIAMICHLSARLSIERSFSSWILILPSTLKHNVGSEN